MNKLLTLIVGYLLEKLYKSIIWNMEACNIVDGIKFPVFLIVGMMMVVGCSDKYENERTAYALGFTDGILFMIEKSTTADFITAMPKRWRQTK